MESPRGHCKCELSGFCSVRNIALKPTLQMICRENKPRIDAMLKGETPPAKEGGGRSTKFRANEKLSALLLSPE